MTTRRQFLYGLGAAATALHMPSLWAAEDKATSRKPNFLLIMADDQGWGDTGYNHHPKIQTPHLDAMAAQSIRFDRFYASHPMCGPTRASFLTGRNNNRCGIFMPKYALPPDEVTLAQRLKKAGYATAHFGKWHLGSVAPDSGSNPSAFGFDHWVSSINFYATDPIFSHNGKALQHEGEGSLLTADEVEKFVRKQAETDTPFLAVVWFGAVHGPPKTTEEYSSLYPGEKKSIADYYGMTTAMDEAVGRLRRVLEETGLRDNTLTLFCSDNGGVPIYNSVTGGKGKKAQIWEGGLRVPGIIEWPAAFPETMRTNIPATTSDIYPTCLDAAGLPLVEDGNERPIDGVSLLPFLREHNESRPPIGFWFMATFEQGKRWSVRPSRNKEKSGDKPNEITGQSHYGYMEPLLEAQQSGEPLPPEFTDIETGLTKTPWPKDRLTGHAAWLDWPWKLHRIQKLSDPNTAEYLLYNLETDPMEAHNVLAEHPERVNTMRAALESWQHDVIADLNRETEKS